jgi:hypothetical protein
MGVVHTREYILFVFSCRATLTLTDLKLVSRFRICVLLLKYYFVIDFINELYLLSLLLRYLHNGCSFRYWGPILSCLMFLTTSECPRVMSGMSFFLAFKVLESRRRFERLREFCLWLIPVPLWYYVDVTFPLECVILTLPLLVLVFLKPLPKEF